MKLIAILALVAAGLTAVDRFLARTEAEELRAAARRSYETGARLLTEGRADAAVDSLRNAHALARERSEDPKYELALVEALIAAGKSGQADSVMGDALERRPNDGEANVVAGRLNVKENRVAEAESYYHRAIYGEWPKDAQKHRIQARMELAHLLQGRNSRRELLAELISLEADAAEDGEIEKQLGPMFMAAGSAARAAAVYREALARNPEDAALYTGLGEAEMEQGQYRAARSAFLQAAYRHPAVLIEPRLELLNRITALDPTPRGLTSREKYDRSLRILQMARDDLAGHLAEAGRPGDAGAEQALREAEILLSGKAPRSPTNEDAERLLDKAQALWRLRVQAFGVAFAPDEEVLRLIMERLTP